MDTFTWVEKAESCVVRPISQEPDAQLEVGNSPQIRFLRDRVLGQHLHSVEHLCKVMTLRGYDITLSFRSRAALPVLIHRGFYSSVLAADECIIVV